MAVTDVAVDRQVARSWLEHDPTRAKIPLEVWRKLRSIKLAPVADAIHDALTDVKTTKRLVADFVKKQGVGRQRALRRLQTRFAGALCVTVGSCAEFRWLEPHPPLIVDTRHPGEAQDCILAHFAIAGPDLNRSSMLLRAWTCETSDHACARLLQRDPAGDRPRLHRAGGA